MFKSKELRIDPELYTNPIYGIHLRVMCFMGFVIDKNEKFEFLYFMRAFCTILCFLSATVANLIKVSRNLNYLEQNAISCASGCLFLTTSVLVVNSWLQRKRIAILVTFLHYDLKRLLVCSDDTEEMYLQNTVRLLRILTLSILAPTFIGCSLLFIDCIYRTIFLPETVFNVPEILNGTAKPILVFAIFPYGEMYDNFIIGYLCPFYATVMTLLIVSIVHPFMVCLMRYIIVKFEIIIKRMKEMDVSKVYESTDNMTTNDGHSNMLPDNEYWHIQLCKFCVEEHIEIRWFYNELEILLQMPLLVNFIICSVFFCFIFYAINSRSLSGFDYVCMFIYLMVVLSTSWIYYWHATLIAVCNDDLRFAIFSSDWYTYKLKVQKALCLIMTDTHQLLRMRAIFIDVNLRSFIDIIRGAFAYFSILRNVSY